MLEITSHTSGNVLILRLEGRIDGDTPSMQIQEATKAALDRGLKNVLLDLGGVQWINSLGVGYLVAAFVSLRNQKGTMKLVGAPSRVVTVLHATGVSPSIIPIFQDEEEAVASFG